VTLLEENGFFVRDDDAEAASGGNIYVLVAYRRKIRAAPYGRIPPRSIMLFWKTPWLASIVILSSLSTSTTTMALTNALTETSKIAVIGAGAAGLATARVMRRAGLEHVTVLEKDTSIGGVWNYQEASPNKPMYRGLRTNLPKEIMAYREFPWSSSVSESFLTHRQVLDYLKDYKDRFQLPVQLG
jgi:hypothetical protein